LLAFPVFIAEQRVDVRNARHVDTALCVLAEIAQLLVKCARADEESGMDDGRVRVIGRALDQARFE
jgi:hypothetical protein